MTHLVITVLIILALIQACVFIVRYLLTDWFRSTMGRHAMFFMGACALILGLAASFQLWGDWIGRDYARIFSYALINLIFGWRNVLLFSGQRRHRPSKDTSGTVS